MQFPTTLIRVLRIPAVCYCRWCESWTADMLWCYTPCLKAGYTFSNESKFQSSLKHIRCLRELLKLENQLNAITGKQSRSRSIVTDGIVIV